MQPPEPYALRDVATDPYLPSVGQDEELESLFSSYGDGPTFSPLSTPGNFSVDDEASIPDTEAPSTIHLTPAPSDQDVGLQSSLTTWIAEHSTPGNDSSDVQPVSCDPDAPWLTETADGGEPHDNSSTLRPCTQGPSNDACLDINDRHQQSQSPSSDLSPTFFRLNSSFHHRRTIRKRGHWKQMSTPPTSTPPSLQNGLAVSSIARPNLSSQWRAPQMHSPIPYQGSDSALDTLDAPASYEQRRITDSSAPTPYFTYLPSSERASESARVLEIGAMSIIQDALLNHSPSSSPYRSSFVKDRSHVIAGDEDDTVAIPEPKDKHDTSRHQLLDMLSGMEQDLQTGLEHCRNGLSACERIKSSLRRSAKVFEGFKQHGRDHTSVPSAKATDMTAGAPDRCDSTNGHDKGNEQHNE